jgi:predicted transcriptional regulator
MVVLEIAQAGNREVTKSPESYAKNLNLEVMHRILQVLIEQGPIKITNLAMHSSLNHITCKKYLQSMGKFGWIKFMSDNYTLIMLTEVGVKIQKALNSLAQTSLKFSDK